MPEYDFSGIDVLHGRKRVSPSIGDFFPLHMKHGRARIFGLKARGLCFSHTLYYPTSHPAFASYLCCAILGQPLFRFRLVTTPRKLRSIISIPFFP